MKSLFWRSAILSLIALAALLSLERISLMAPKTQGGQLLGRVVKKLRKHDLNREDQEAAIAGYYEGLLNEGRRAASTNSPLTGSWARDWTVGEAENNDPNRKRGDFLAYEFKPNVNQRHHAGWLITNSFGMADREYSRRKVPHTRRIALLGDSIVEGSTAPFGHNFEALLEDRLNERHLNHEIRKFEILNFGVGGYRMTQILEVAIEKAPALEPDAYVVGISDVTIFRYWASHIVSLVRSGTDLKYDFLRKVARDASLNPADKVQTFDAKLAAFRLPTLRWVLAEIKDHAARSGAPVIVLLIPTVEDPEVLAERFTGVRTLVAELNIPVVDLLDTFVGIQGLDEFRISKSDVHPNERGHNMIFQNLYRKILDDPEVFSKLIGHARR